MNFLRALTPPVVAAIVAGATGSFIWGIGAGVVVLSATTIYELISRGA